MTIADATASAGKSLCANCNEHFNKRRKDQKHCSDRCRKSAHKRRDRADNPSNATFSPTKHRDQMVKFDTALRLAEMYYFLPPGERFGFLEELVQLARSGDAPLVRDILCTPKLLNPPPSEKHLFFCFRPKLYKTIPQLVDAYCRKSPWRAGVVEVVKGRIPEPPTGEVREDRTVEDGLGFEVSLRKTSTPYYRGQKYDPRVHPWYGSDHPLLRTFQCPDLDQAA